MTPNNAFSQRHELNETSKYHELNKLSNFSHWMGHLNLMDFMKMSEYRKLNGIHRTLNRDCCSVLQCVVACCSVLQLLLFTWQKLPETNTDYRERRPDRGRRTEKEREREREREKSTHWRDRTQDREIVRTTEREVETERESARARKKETLPRRNIDLSIIWSSSREKTW